MLTLRVLRTAVCATAVSCRLPYSRVPVHVYTAVYVLEVILFTTLCHLVFSFLHTSTIFTSGFAVYRSPSFNESSPIPHVSSLTRVTESPGGSPSEGPGAVQLDKFPPLSPNPSPASVTASDRDGASRRKCLDRQHNTLEQTEIGNRGRRKSIF